MKPMNKRLTDLEAIKPRVKLDHSDWVSDTCTNDNIVNSSGRHYLRLDDVKTSRGSGTVTL